VNWVLCGGMKRSGSTLQYQIASEIVEVAGLGMRIGYVFPREFATRFQELDTESDWVVAKSHEFIPELGKLASQPSTKVVYVFRDMRDVVVSMMADQNRHFWRLIMSGHILDLMHHGELWESWQCVLVTKYEDMISDLEREVGRISEFLGVDLSSAEVEDIALKYSIENQRKRISSFDFSTQGYRKPGTVTVVDPSTNLHANHIRSGKHGRWKEELSPIEVFVVESIAREWLLAHGYSLSTLARFRPLAMAIGCCVVHVGAFARHLLGIGEYATE
jgi:hypothetical protein